MRNSLRRLPWVPEVFHVSGFGQVLTTPRQNVYAGARLSISSLFFSHTFQSDQSLPRALGFLLCAACGSVVLLHAARVFDYFVELLKLLLRITRHRSLKQLVDCVSVKSKLQHPRPGIPRAFDTFVVPGRDYQRLPGGGEFEPHAKGVGNLNRSLDFM